MGAMRLCFLLFCFFLVSVSSPVRKRNNSCTHRPPWRQGRNRGALSSRYKEFIQNIRNRVLPATPPPPPCPPLLDNIDALKSTGYGRPNPRHGLQLLFWFAQNVKMVDNNHIVFNVDPIRSSYGFHYFGNKEPILPLLCHEQKYYEVGNLFRDGNSLPEYVRQNLRNTNQPERNMDRLIVSLDKNTSSKISRVFITSHNLNQNDFNGSDTYEISPALILQIRQISCNNYVTFSTSKHDNEDDGTKEKGYSLFLSATGYSSNDCTTPDNRRQKRSSYSQCNAYEGMKLQIKTTTQGYSKLIWENIPADIMKNNKNVYIDICQNTHSSDPNEEPTQVMAQNIKTSSGALNTSVSLNAGLQPRLRLYKSYFRKDVIWYGPEFDGANKVVPIRIKGFDASLQLYVKNRKACARLYIKKTFSDWKDVLYYSWVGFYKTSQDRNDDYSTYQYAVKFALIDNSTINNYDIYQYDSSLVIAPGVQIRFLLDNNIVLAQTTPWESDEKVTSVCDIENLQSEPSSTWPYPEFFYEPEFYDANNVIPIKIQKYDAGLQLFTKDGKACARLYIKKTFTNWKTTFYYSWVGFYTSSQKNNEDYATYFTKHYYQYAVDFEKIGDGTKNFDVYQYKSELAIAPGIQIRFLLDKSYKLAETEPWKNG